MEKLPERWHIEVNEHNIGIIAPYYNKQCNTCCYTNAVKSGWKFFRSHDYLGQRITDGNCTSDIAERPEYDDPESTEITLSYFIEHVLNKKIDGYIAPMSLFEGKVQKGTIYRPLASNKNTTYCATKLGGISVLDSGNTNLPKEIVERWEPWFKPSFNIGDWIIPNNYAHQHACEIVRYIDNVIIVFDENCQSEKGFTLDFVRLATESEIDDAKKFYNEMNGYKAEYFENHIEYGRAKITKEQILGAYALVNLDCANSNEWFKSFTIGNCVFSREAIIVLAKHFNKQ